MWPSLFKLSLNWPDSQSVLCKIEHIKYGAEKFHSERCSNYLAINLHSNPMWTYVVAWILQAEESCLNSQDVPSSVRLDWKDAISLKLHEWSSALLDGVLNMCSLKEKSLFKLQDLLLCSLQVAWRMQACSQVVRKMTLLCYWISTLQVNSK